MKKNKFKLFKLNGLNKEKLFFLGIFLLSFCVSVAFLTTINKAEPENPLIAEAANNSMTAPHEITSSELDELSEIGINSELINQEKTNAGLQQKADSNAEDKRQNQPEQQIEQQMEEQSEQKPEKQETEETEEPEQQQAEKEPEKPQPAAERGPQSPAYDAKNPVLPENPKQPTVPKQPREPIQPTGPSEGNGDDIEQEPNDYFEIIDGDSPGGDIRYDGFFTTTIKNGEVVGDKNYSFSIIQKDHHLTVEDIEIKVNGSKVQGFFGKVLLTDGENTISIKITYSDQAGKKIIAQRNYIVFVDEGEIIITTDLADTTVDNPDRKSVV